MIRNPEIPQVIIFDEMPRRVSIPKVVPIGMNEAQYLPDFGAGFSHETQVQKGGLEFN